MPKSWRTARRFAPDLRRFIENEWGLRPEVEALFVPDALKDDELRMMFSCCHPRLHEDVQVALVLKMLCGFGVDEIASAFFVSAAAIEKRLSRGKKVLAESKRLFELTERAPRAKEDLLHDIVGVELAVRPEPDHPPDHPLVMSDDLVEGIPVAALRAGDQLIPTDGHVSELVTGRAGGCEQKSGAGKRQKR